METKELFPCLNNLPFPISVLTAKLARLKQAKEEAEKEILNYRAHMEAEFQKKVAAVCIKHIMHNTCRSYLVTTHINFMFLLRFWHIWLALRLICKG